MIAGLAVSFGILVTQTGKCNMFSPLKVLVASCITFASMFLANYYLNNNKDRSEIESAITKNDNVRNIVGSVIDINIISRTIVMPRQVGEATSLIELTLRVKINQ